MLAGCAPFQPYHRQDGQLRVNATIAPAPTNASPTHCAGLVHQLFHSQHDTGAYEVLNADDEPPLNFEQDEAFGSGLPGRNFHDELAKLVSPFLSGTGLQNHDLGHVNCHIVDRINDTGAHTTFPIDTYADSTKLEMVMGDPLKKIGNRDQTSQQQESPTRTSSRLEDKEDIKRGPQQNLAGRCDPNWLPFEKAISSAPAEHSEAMWESPWLEPGMQATPASSTMSSAQALEEGTSLIGATTASARGSCSPTSAAMSAESPSPAPSSSLVLQHNSPAVGAPTSSKELAITGTIQNRNHGTRPRSSSSGMSRLPSLRSPATKSLSFSEVPPCLLSHPNEVLNLSLVQQQNLMAEEEREESIELVSLLVACVEAITAGSLTFINHFLARLGRLASPTGSSPMHRLAAYFTEGLACRASTLWPRIYMPLQQEQDMRCCESWAADSASALQALNHATPLVKFSHFTANEMILQAFEGERRVHVIDLDIKQGLQWPALFHCLANRRGGPPQHVRVTGIGECKEAVEDTGDRLAEFAEEVGLKLEFHGVVDKLEDVRLWMLHVKAEPREAVAVNCIMQLHRTLHDDSGTTSRNVLSLIHSTHPKVVALVEQEVDCHDHPSLQTRFSNAMRYFGAMFDSLDACLPTFSPARFKAEAYFAAHIRNIVACDGRQRMERYQPLGRWQRLLTPAGFHCIPLSQRTHLQAHILLGMFSTSTSGFNLLLPHSDGQLHHLTLAWLDQPLYTASAWAPSS